MKSVIVTTLGEYEVPKDGKWEVEDGPLDTYLNVFSKSGKCLYRFHRAEVLGVAKKRATRGECDK